MKKFFIIGVLVLAITGIKAQDSLYMPNEFVKSYREGYRNYDGTPGKNYFTNYSDYQINVYFNAETGHLKGIENIVYHNNSKDTLKEIVVRLYKNIHKTGSPRAFRMPEADINDGVKINEVKVENKSLDVNKLNIYSTRLTLKLDKPLAPNGKINLFFDWELDITGVFPIRNGKYGDNVYFVGYWYPQVAVYDDVFGWDKNLYTGPQEFYNDHSNFDVKITIDGHNLVWATGVWQNPSDVLTSKYYEKYRKALHSKEVVHIVTPESLQKKDVLRHKQNVWHFKAEKVPDFAFSVSNQHNWDAVSLAMPDRPDPVLIQAVYADSSKVYHSLAETARKIIDYYSFHKPKIYYPYPRMTVFEGGGGMEYPMMVNMGDEEDTCRFRYLVAHEVGHTYFPFMTGTNETRYAWMDEGLMSFFPRIVVNEIWKECNSVPQILSNYGRIAGTTVDMPTITPANLYQDFWAYRHIAYDRPAFTFYILRQMKGDSLFFEALREFAKTWKYKHPYPYDFFFTFNKVYGEDLSWFWRPYFFEFAKPDLAISDARYDGANLFIRIKNKGGMPLPLNVEIKLDNGQIVKYTQKADIWKEKDYYDISLSLQGKPVEIKLKTKNSIDIDKTNNIKKL